MSHLQKNLKHFFFFYRLYTNQKEILPEYRPKSINLCYKIHEFRNQVTIADITTYI